MRWHMNTLLKILLLLNENFLVFYCNDDDESRYIRVD